MCLLPRSGPSGQHPHPHQLLVAHTTEAEGDYKTRGQGLGATALQQEVLGGTARLQSLLAPFATTEQGKSQLHLRRKYTMLGTGPEWKEDPTQYHLLTL